MPQNDVKSTNDRNRVPRRDAISNVALFAKMAERLAEQELREHPDTYNPDCPPPIHTRQSYLLKRSSNTVDSVSYHLVFYNHAHQESSLPILPQGEYTYVCIHNNNTQKDEIRCGSNEDGKSVHLLLSGNAHHVVCAGKLAFSTEGKLLGWNTQSGSYRPTDDDAVETGFPMELYRRLNEPFFSNAIVEDSTSKDTLGQDGLSKKGHALEKCLPSSKRQKTRYFVHGGHGMFEQVQEGAGSETGDETPILNRVSNILDGKLPYSLNAK